MGHQHRPACTSSPSGLARSLAWESKLSPYCSASEGIRPNLSIPHKPDSLLSTAEGTPPRPITNSETRANPISIRQNMSTRDDVPPTPSGEHWYDRRLRPVAQQRTRSTLGDLSPHDNEAIVPFCLEHAPLQTHALASEQCTAVLSGISCSGNECLAERLSALTRGDSHGIMIVWAGEWRSAGGAVGSGVRVREAGRAMRER